MNEYKKNFMFYCDGNILKLDDLNYTKTNFILNDIRNIVYKKKYHSFSSTKLIMEKFLKL